MRKLTLGLFAVLGCMALILPLAAQEGFPMKGSWLGEWGEGTTKNQVFVVFDWDGKVISGAINPGTEMIAVKNASLNPTPGAPPAGTPAAAPAGGGGGGRGGNRGGGGGGQGAAPGAPVPALPAAGGGAQAGGAGGRGGNGAGQSVAAPPVEWIVHFEGDGKDSKGATVHYVVDGKIENIGLYNRSIVGTWVSGTTKAPFKITRQ